MEALRELSNEVNESRQSKLTNKAGMEEFRKQRAMNRIWVSNRLEGTLPTGVTQFETFNIHSKIYNGDTHEQGDETNHKSRQQLQQHFEDFMNLCIPRSNTFEPEINTWNANERPCQ